LRSGLRDTFVIWYSYYPLEDRQTFEMASEGHILDRVCIADDVDADEYQWAIMPFFFSM